MPNEVWFKQHEFLANTSRFRAFIAGRGTGKTVCGAIAALDPIYQSPNGIGMVTAPSHDAIRDSLLPVCRDYWGPRGGKFTNAAPYKCEFPNGHRVSFRSTEKPELLRGPSLSWLWMDEAGLNRKGCWGIALPALRDRKGKAAPAWITTTPKQPLRGRDNLKQILKRNQFSVVTASTFENPFTSRQYKLDLLREFSGLLKAQELDGRFVTLGAGVIKREWFHVEQYAPADLHWCRAWDPAFSSKLRADRTAGICCARAPNGHYWFRDGIAGRWEPVDARKVILDAMQSEPWPVGIESVASQSMLWKDIALDPRAAARAVEPLAVSTDKLTRALPWISRASQGMVHFVAGEWVEPWLAEVEEFPDGEHDDRVDAMSLAYELSNSSHVDTSWLDDMAARYGVAEGARA